MSFEKFLENGLLDENFGKARFSFCFKERQNLSKMRLDSESGCKYLDPGGAYKYTHEELMGVRYAACGNLTFDIAFSVYEVNTKTLMLWRVDAFTKDKVAAIEREIARVRGPNFECRLIGMQNGQDYRHLGQLVLLLRRKKLKLFEIDLFGNEVRNVAFDVKTGLTFDVLMENRPYKPGEQVNRITADQYQRSLNPSAAQAAVDATLSKAKRKRGFF